MPVLTSLLSGLRWRLRLFAEDARASLSVETAMIMPLLTWWYVGSFVYFDAFRAQNINLKAAYTLSDMISRQRTPVDESYMAGLNKVFDYLTNSQKPTWIRATSIYWDGTDKRFEVNWSYATKSKPALTTTTLQAKASQIPAMPVGDTVIVIETSMAYEPFFNVGLGARWFDNLIVTRPRYQCITWKDQGC